MILEKLHPKVLEIDCERTAELICAAIRDQVSRILKKQGAVVGISGGIDSAVVAALCARALGPERTLGLFTPEQDSAEETLTLSRAIAERLNIEAVLEDISPILQATGCYRRRDEAIRSVIPEYTADWKSKIVLPSVIDSDQYRLFSVVAISPTGETIKRRLSLSSYLGVVAATNFKQRTRKMIEYYHADRLNYAVTGTPNRLEYDQGFFVKGGDGLADFKPIAHLYKSQVYQLAAYLNIPEATRNRPPTTDTYSMPQEQDEFYFSLSYEKMDLCLYAKNHGYSAESVSDAVELRPEQVRRVFKDIDNKRRTTRYQHLSPLLINPVEEIAVNVISN
jgi:NAD+ synthase